MFGRKRKLFNLMGFEVSLDPSWVILAILVAWSLSTGFFPFHYEDLTVRTYWIMGILGAIGLFFSIVAHEFCHSLVARRSGLPMKGITLFIFGGVAEMGNEPPSAKDEFYIAVVGPLSSFAIAFIFYGFTHIGDATGWPIPLNAVFAYLAMINLMLGIFNLVPAFPLDGGRIFRAALWAWKGNLRWATRISSYIGSGFGLMLIFYGILQMLSGYVIGGMWLFLIGIFIYNAAKMSYQQLLTRQALEGEPLKRFMTDNPVFVNPSITLNQLVEDYVYRYHFKLFPVVDGEKLVGCISTRQIKEIPQEEWPHKHVGELALNCSSINTIKPDADAIEAISVMRRNGTSRLMVVEQNQLIGIISLKDMLEFLNLKVELDQS
jgi:Zn-dependent protease/CBS domain-containing protein